MEYIPYTYLIGWSKLNKWYYGCQYARSKNRISNPINLWKTYFTSSKYVKEFIEKYGDPDIIEIRKTFCSKEKCKLWEEKVIDRLNIVKDEKWLNRSNGNKKFVNDDNSAKKISESLKGNEPWNKGKKTGPQDPELIKKRTKASGEKRRGKKFSEEHKQSLSQSHIGQVPWNKNKKGVQVPWNKNKKDIYSEETKRLMGVKNVGKEPWNKKEKVNETHY